MTVPALRPPNPIPNPRSPRAAVFYDKDAWSFIVHICCSDRDDGGSGEDGTAVDEIDARYKKRPILLILEIPLRDVRNCHGSVVI